jgi:hypothetical protein
MSAHDDAPPLIACDVEGTEEHLRDALGIIEAFDEALRSRGFKCTDSKILAALIDARSSDQTAEFLEAMADHRNRAWRELADETARELVSVLESIDTNVAELAASAASIANSLDTIATFTGMGDGVTCDPTKAKRGA